MSLELQQVSLKVDGESHIYPVDLTLVPGEFNILLGTTLAGKTSLMRLMAGLEKPTTGNIVFEGQDVTGQSVQKRDVAMVYQQFINYPNFTVYQNIASPMQLRGLDRAGIKKAVNEVADLLQLTPMLKRLPGELSGGQQQRVALARALVKGSRLVLLDEPLANLDYKLREELREQLPILFRDAGATVVYATTEPGEALLLGGQTAAMHEGRVTQFGATASVYQAPNSALTASVFSDPPMNLVSVTKRDNRLSLNNDASWPLPSTAAALADGTYQLGVRPHHITLTPQGDASVPVRGSVLLNELTGSDSTIHADVAGNTWISQTQGIHKVQRGDSVELYVNPERCFLFDTTGQRVAS